MSGTRHSRRRDRQAISHHYDVGNDFYRIVLGESMVYSCAYWTSTEPGYGLADAQRDKLDLICRKLDLQPGMRLLDVGCGWGSLALHAAREYGVTVVGITLSTEQADYARKQVAEAGLTDAGRDPDPGLPRPRRRPVRRDRQRRDGRARRHRAVRRVRGHPVFGSSSRGGRLLNHQIAAIHPEPQAARSERSFIDAYVFPDGELAPIGTTVTLLEGAGFEVRDMQALREHYARTLRAWVANLEARLVGGGTADQPGAGAGVAALHGRVRAGLRARADRRQPGPGGEDASRRHERHATDAVRVDR